MKPRARAEGLLVRDLGGERVVYDLDRHQAHCLNPSAARVFEHCDGGTTVEDMAAALRVELGAEVDEQWVGVALAGLEDAHLLEPRASRPSVSPGRRELLRQAGVGAALLLPAVVSMVAPTPAEAAATCIPEAACDGTTEGQNCYRIGSPSDCDNNYTCQSGSCLP